MLPMNLQTTWESFDFSTRIVSRMVWQDLWYISLFVWYVQDHSLNVPELRPHADSMLSRFLHLASKIVTQQLRLSGEPYSCRLYTTLGNRQQKHHPNWQLLVIFFFLYLPSESVWSKWSGSLLQVWSWNKKRFSVILWFFKISLCVCVCVCVLGDYPY